MPPRPARSPARVSAQASLWVHLFAAAVKTVPCFTPWVAGRFELSDFMLYSVLASMKSSPNSWGLARLRAGVPRRGSAGDERRELGTKG